MPTEGTRRTEIQPKPGYTVEFPSPWRPLGVSTSAHINKLMIIAKRKNHTQDKHKQKERVS